METTIPLVDFHADLELGNTTDIFRVKVGDKIYICDILSHLSSTELVKILSEKGIKANNLNRSKLVELAEKAVKDVYISDNEFSTISAESTRYVGVGICCAILIAVALLCAILLLVLF